MRRLSGALLVALLMSVGLVAPARATAGAVGSPVALSAARSATAVLGMRVIGHSVKGRPIRAWHLGDRTSPVKAVFIATMHGNESGPASILNDLRDGPPITGADIWVVPYMNPDGYARNTRQNAHRVDLNRNFPVNWIRQYGTYNSGRRPASEPETRAMMRFLGVIRPRFIVSFHQPLFGVDMTNGSKVQPLALRLHRYLELPRNRFTCNNGCHGTMTQWFNKRFPGAAVTVEYGTQLTDREAHVTGPTGLLRAIFATR